MSRFFKKALPICVERFKNEMNITCGYRADFDYSGGVCSLNVTGNSFYHIFINGKFYSYGPARAAHGFYRVDEYDITSFLKYGKNSVAFEVCGYNINSFEFLDQPPFLQAEITVDGDTVFSTGIDSINAFWLDSRIQRVQRHSFQRCFVECYNLGESFSDWRQNGKGTETVSVCQEVSLLPRRIPNLKFCNQKPTHNIAFGNVEVSIPESYHHDRAQTAISFDFPILKGYKYEEEEIHLSDELQNYVFKPLQLSEYSNTLKRNKYISMEWKKVESGLVELKFTCSEESIFYVRFDEKLIGGDIDPNGDCVNAIRIKAQKGTYSFLSSNIYSFKYMKIFCVSGSVSLDEIGLKTVECPVEIINNFKIDDSDLKKVYQAAIATFRENAVDIFMDCPGRERAGWLCDSFFTARTEKYLTGKNLIEYNFLENYILNETFEYIPNGMVPMCYPADHGNGSFIPNWAMWLIVELGDYYKRTKDPNLVKAFKSRVYGIIKYFENFENEYGLLENLEGWMFLEWSAANTFIQDVNYPTNMLYCYALKTVGELYADKELTEKAEALKAVIRERSFNGKFFVDSEKRAAHKEIQRRYPTRMTPQKKDYTVSGKLEKVNEITETCQYYAFFFDIATPEEYPELWDMIITQFGPGKKNENIYPADAFVGNYLRLEILSRYGLKKQLLEESIGYFGYMADRTGTLWEKISDNASCNHGFASYVAYLIGNDLPQ